MTKNRKRTAGLTLSKKARITKRVVDIKRHTIGYVVGGKTYSVSQTRKMASRGELSNVRVVGYHIQSVPGKGRLIDLPIALNK